MHTKTSLRVGIAANPLTSTAESIVYLANLLKPNFIETKTFSNDIRPTRNLPHYISLAPTKVLTYETLHQPLYINTQKHDPRIHGVANSMGIPSPPLRDIRIMIRKTLNLLRMHQSSTNLIFSIHGSSFNGFTTMAHLARECNVSYISLNLSCPNISSHKQTLLYKDPNTLDTLLQTLMPLLGSIRVLTKVGIFMPHEQLLLAELIKILTKHNVHALYGINSVPMTILTHDNIPAFGPTRRVCGVSGPPIAKLARHFVKTARKAIDTYKSNLRLFGCGGITTRNDITTLHALGADVVMSATRILTDAQFRFEQKTKGATHDTDHSISSRDHSSTLST